MAVSTTSYRVALVQHALSFFCFLLSVPICFSGLCRPLKDTLSGHEGKGLMKVIVNATNDRVVGIHLVGAEVAEILQASQTAFTVSC